MQELALAADILEIVCKSAKYCPRCSHLGGEIIQGKVEKAY
ncbi:MAG: hypothetical protein PWQ97_535 [Tepidanaerobacteraceae bacterium]|nr:hypothetical protein [Tepidanaerobacteraceae bacterium]